MEEAVQELKWKELDGDTRCSNDLVQEHTVPKCGSVLNLRLQPRKVRDAGFCLFHFHFYLYILFSGIIGPNFLAR